MRRGFQELRDRIDRICRIDRIDRIEWCLIVGCRELLRVTVIAWERLRLTPKMVSTGESIVAGPSIEGNRSILSIL